MKINEKDRSFSFLLIWHLALLLKFSQPFVFSNYSNFSLIFMQDSGVNNEYEYKANSFLVTKGSVHSLCNLFESVRLRCIQRGLWHWRDYSCPANPPSPNLHHFNIVSHCMAVGVGWGDSV